jgi:serine protease Do
MRVSPDDPFLETCSAVKRALPLQYPSAIGELKKEVVPMCHVRKNGVWTLCSRLQLAILLLLLGTPGIRVFGSGPDTVPPDSEPLELTLEALSTLARPSLVVVKSTDRIGRELGQGAGFVIDERGLIATARHVIGDGREMTVELPDGTKPRVLEVYASSHQLDLAIVRIETSGLIPLSISDDEETAQGREVIAMGHPQGSQYQMARGLVSGHLEMDGVRMLQLAMPIEPGNSGGPVLDRHGHVVGVVTMKSTAVDDVGFAIPVKHLRELRDHPNPIPIERWKTIGVMDPRQWSIVFGANWTQRAGRIDVAGSGTSFGGRTLCLRQRRLPQLPCDISVTVRLDDEQGAAGLVFHADGQDRHYGFYPSNGQLRLTRFSGPDVGSWTILHNAPHPAYRPGDWNTLTVRIHNDHFECFVNGTRVLESSDRELVSEPDAGQIGLAAFRGTHAEFRQFSVGANLVPQPLDDSSRRLMESLIASVARTAPADQNVVEQLIPLGTSLSPELEREARQLEQRAAQLRQLSKDVHEFRVRRQLAEILQLPGFKQEPRAETENTPEDNEPEDRKDVDLMRASLLLAQIDNPDVDVESYLLRIEEMAAELQEAWPEEISEVDKLSRLDVYLFENLGIRGSRFEYDAQSNSYLNEVIDDREGLPITLSVLYMEIARRVGLNVVGVGLPGHFVVRFEPTQPGQSPVTIDPFERGKRLSEQDVSQIIATAGFPDEPRFREATSPIRIVERMTMNLLRRAENERLDAAVLRYLETLVMLAPDNLEYRAKRLEMRARTGRTAAAIEDADFFIQQHADEVNVEQVRSLKQSLEKELERIKTEPR